MRQGTDQLLFPIVCDRVGQSHTMDRESCCVAGGMFVAARIVIALFELVPLVWS